LNFFEIRQWFPATDDRSPFGLLTIAPSPHAEFAFYLTSADQLRSESRRFALTESEIAAINPNTYTAPMFRSRYDAELTAKIYVRVPVLIEESCGEEGNPWGIDFRQGLFNMTSDSGSFRTGEQLAEAGYIRQKTNWISPVKPLEPYIPLYEAKMMHQFDHRWATYNGVESRNVEPAEKRQPRFEPEPRYWVPEKAVRDRISAKGWSHSWLIGWRDICRSTDERTVISTAIPEDGCGNKVLLMFPQVATSLCMALLGNLNSLVLDFVARQKLGGTSLTYFIMKQLPILPPNTYTTQMQELIAARVLELTYTSHSLSGIARDLGYDGPPFPWDEDRRAVLRAELDAWYAHAYGLSRDELRYILDPADVLGPDCPSETFRVLKNNEMKR
jgi:hypothetical protein